MKESNATENGTAVGGSDLQAVVGHFYLLDDGDMIRAEDEFLEDDCEKWTSMREAGKLFIGCHYARALFKPMRRAMRPPNAALTGARPIKENETGDD